MAVVAPLAAQNCSDYSKDPRPDVAEGTFAVWNDTHENAETLRALHERTAALKPDFLL